MIASPPGADGLYKGGPQRGTRGRLAKRGKRAYHALAAYDCSRAWHRRVGARVAEVRRVVAGRDLLGDRGCQRAVGDVSFGE